MDAHSTVTAEEGDRYPLVPPKFYAPLAQSGMRRLSQKENRVGSNPTRGTKFRDRRQDRVPCILAH